MRIRVAIALSCLAMASMSVADPAVAAIRKLTNIPAQGLGPALRSLATDREVQVLYRSELVGDRRTSGAVGDLTLEEALMRLLSGTDLTFTYLDEHTVMIEAVRSEPPARPRSTATPVSAPAAQTGKVGALERWRMAQATPAMESSTNPSEASHAPASQRASAALEEVVVTATKKEQALLDVPIPIQVYSAESLEQISANDFEDYARFAPGLSFTKGRSGQTNVVMRGLSTGNVTNGQPQNRSLVGIYLDDAPIQLTGFNFDPDIFDIERIEVLKGPQGTLFGDSAMAGAIRYVTTRPDSRASSARMKVSTSSTAGGGENYAVRGMVNMPINDQFAVRASGYYRDESGWIDNVRLSRNDVNSEEIYGGRISGLYQPNEVLSIQATVAAQRSSQGGAPETDGPVTTRDNWYQNREEEEGRERALLANLTVNAELPFGTLTSVSSYIDRDYEFYVAGGMERFMLLVFGEHLPGTRLFYPWKQEFLTEELRFTGTIGDRIEYTLGGFYADQQINYPTYGDDKSYGNRVGFDQYLVNRGMAPSVEAVQATYGCPLNQNAFCGYLNTLQKQLAFFADATVAITDQLEMQLGARVVDWKQDYDEKYAGFFNGGPKQKQQTIREDTVNPRFNLSYKISPDANVYVSAGKGFRFGGVNDPLPVTCDAELAAQGLSQPDKFESDSLWTYELGAKTRLLDRRVSLNGSVFYVNWDEIQTTRALACGFRIIENAGKVVSKGLEFDSTISFTDALQITVAGSYTDATLDEPSRNLGAAQGDRAPYVPEWKASAYGSYTFPLTDRWMGFANAGVTSYGDSYTTFSPTAFARATVPGATIATLTLGAELERIRVSLFAENLTDEEIVYTITRDPAAGAAPVRNTTVYGRPRTIGVDFEYRF